MANAFAERWIGSIRRELLDRTVIWNQRQPGRLVVGYIDHYNTRRPHRSRTGPTAHSTNDHPSPPTLPSNQMGTSKS